MDSKWQICEIKEIEDWEGVFHSLPRPYLSQSYAYGFANYHTRGLGLRHFAFERNGEVAAICQTRTKRVAGIPVAARIEHGPMFVEEAPSFSTRRDVMRLVRGNWRLFRKGPVKIQPGLDDSEENQRLMRDLGFRDMKTEGWWSARIDLSLDEETLRKHLTSSWRKQLNSACRKGLTLTSSVSQDSLEWLLKKHEANMQRKGFCGASSEFVAALHKARPKDFHILRATMDGEPVSGACWIKFGSVAQSFVGWFGDQGRQYNSGNFLYWSAMMEMKKAGCKWLDVGGLFPSHGYTHFKKGMGGTEYKLLGDWISI